MICLRSVDIPAARGAVPMNMYMHCPTQASLGSPTCHQRPDFPLGGQPQQIPAILCNLFGFKIENRHPGWLHNFFSCCSDCLPERGLGPLVEVGDSRLAWVGQSVYMCMSTAPGRLLHGFFFLVSRIGREGWTSFMSD